MTRKARSLALYGSKGSKIESLNPKIESLNPKTESLNPKTESIIES